MRFFPAKTVEQALERLHDERRAACARLIRNYGKVSLVNHDVHEGLANIETPNATKAFAKKGYKCHVPVK